MTGTGTSQLCLSATPTMSAPTRAMSAPPSPNFADATPFLAICNNCKEVIWFYKKNRKYEPFGLHRCDPHSNPHIRWRPWQSPTPTNDERLVNLMTETNTSIRRNFEAKNEDHDSGPIDQAFGNLPASPGLFGVGLSYLQLVRSPNGERMRAARTRRFWRLAVYV